METITQENNQVAVINNSIEVFKGAPQVLIAHQNRAAKAIKVGEAILKQWEDAYAIEDPIKRMEALATADKRSNDFLANCGKANSEMQESRKAITQLMDMLKKMYTEEENKLDSKKGMVPAKVQDKRNGYAKELFEEQERQKKLAEEKAAKSRESVEITAYIKNQIAQCLLNYLANKKMQISNRFNEITLSNYDEKATALHLMKCDFPTEKLKEVVKYTAPSYYKHSDAEFLVLQGEIEQGYDFASFYNEYSRQIGELKQSLIDRLPSKKEELLEQKRLADEAEAKRQAELERQRIAEEERQRQLAASKSDEERKRKEREGEEARKAEAERMAAMEREAEVERIRLENERLNREAADKRRLEEEAAAARKAEEEKVEMEKASGTAQLLFDQVTESSLSSQAPEARTGYDIVVIHPAGWVELFQFWYQREGCKMKVEDMGKKSLNQMKAFAEGVAKKDGEKIESKFLRYETSIKSVNRKATV
jgi:hypothetical protein